MRNILYIVPSDYDSLKKKGVVNMIKERDEDGFFDNVLTLHPFTRNNREVIISDNNKIIEYGWKSKLDFFNNFLVTKIIGTLTIIFKLLFVFPFIVKKEKIDIIRATDPYYMGLLGLYYSKILKIPFVVSIHSDYDKGAELGGQTFNILGSRKLAKKLEKIIYNRADNILPISNYLKERIINEYNIKVEKISIFSHGISFSAFEQTSFIDIKNNFHADAQYILTYVARLSKEKHCLDILGITVKLLEIRDDFCILVAGDGEKYTYMQNFITDNNLTKKIKLLGFQPKKLIVNLRKQANINICFLDGFSLIEACASAKPVIAYNTEWHKELVKNNETGLLVEENNIDEVVDKICYLLDNPDITEYFGKNARELAYNNHDIKNTTKIKQEIYKKILK